MASKNLTASLPSKSTFFRVYSKCGCNYSMVILVASSVSWAWAAKDAYYLSLFLLQCTEYHWTMKTVSFIFRYFNVSWSNILTIPSYSTLLSSCGIVLFVRNCDWSICSSALDRIFLWQSAHFPSIWYSAAESVPTKQTVCFPSTADRLWKLVRRLDTNVHGQWLWPCGALETLFPPFQFYIFPDLKKDVVLHFLQMKCVLCLKQTQINIFILCCVYIYLSFNTILV